MKPQNLIPETRYLRNWLLLCCALVFAMTVVGAITRLTESGLSITEWRPITGAIPPLTEEEWRKQFDLYRASPEFHISHFWMGVEDYKKIYFWEWLHRLLGRFIGIAFAAPLAFFWAKGWIPQGYKPRLLAVLALGFAQGFMGWYMVASGLVDRPAVSHYRLAAHLFLALLIYGSMLWLALGLREREKTPGDARLFVHARVVVAFVLTTIIWGAFTAGLDGGLLYNDTFPKMGDTFLPPELWRFEPAYTNFIANPPVVQFVHRWLAMATVAMVASLWGHAVKRKWNHWAVPAAGAMALAQMGLGIATLFSGVSIPVAAAHQAGAVILLSLLITVAHKLRPKV